jgi:uncharacterized protein YndB with AHSA1/START domain
MELHEDVVRREVILDCPREEAWDAVTDLESWLGDEAAVHEATVEEIVPGLRIALRWTVDGQPETLVDVTLDDAGEDRTRVVVVEIPVRVLQAVGAEIGSGMFSGPMMVAA